MKKNLTDNQKKILHALKNEIRRKKISQKQISEALGVNESTVSLFLKGKTGDASYMLIRLIEILDLEISRKEEETAVVSRRLKSLFAETGDTTN
jgi:predicted XRE-type DNA-binding protein